MKQIIISLFLSSMVLSGCKGQNNEEANNTSKETINQPQTEVKVNKEYDENGNVVRYDSTYSYYYSNIDGDSLLEDSIMSNFKNHLNINFGFSSDPFFDDFFFQDSLMQYDFYNNDFFIERYRNNHKKMNDLFFEMDSIKNLFFEEQFKNSNNKKLKK